MTNKIELTYDELFLLEMAVDEVLWKLEENSPEYKRYRELNELLYVQRRSFNRKEINNARSSVYALH